MLGGKIPEMTLLGWWLFSSSRVNNPEPEEHKGGNDAAHDDDDWEDETDDIDVALAIVGAVCVLKTDFVKVVHDKTEQDHEEKNLDKDKEVVLVCDTPNHTSLILTHPLVKHNIK